MYFHVSGSVTQLEIRGIVAPLYLTKEHLTVTESAYKKQD